jgi:hypothetical protein
MASSTNLLFSEGQYEEKSGSVVGKAKKRLDI